MTLRLAAGSRPDDVDLERDRALVERCQLGDATAFDDLYLRYYARLCRFCLRKLRDPAEAEDTAQEAFARAWRALPTFNGERRFYPWLSVIASNLCVDLIRRKARSTPVGDDELDLALPVIDGVQEAAVEGQADRELLVQAMDRLSPRYREVLELREGNEWSYQRIAQHQGVHISTVETLLYRARRSLRREFLLLADGRAGLAGLFVVLAKLIPWRRSRSLPVGPSSASGASGAGVGGVGSLPTSVTASAVAGAAPAATVTGAGVGLLPVAAGVLATALAAGAFAVVASLIPHGTSSAPRAAAIAPGTGPVGAVAPLTALFVPIAAGSGAPAGGVAAGGSRTQSKVYGVGLSGPSAPGALSGFGSDGGPLVRVLGTGPRSVDSLPKVAVPGARGVVAGVGSVGTALEGLVSAITRQVTVPPKLPVHLPTLPKVLPKPAVSSLPKLVKTAVPPVRLPVPPPVHHLPLGSGL